MDEDDDAGDIGDKRRRCGYCLSPGHIATNSDCVGRIALNQMDGSLESHCGIAESMMTRLQETPPTIRLTIEQIARGFHPGQSRLVKMGTYCLGRGVTKLKAAADLLNEIAHQLFATAHRHRKPPGRLLDRGKKTWEDDITSRGLTIGRSRRSIEELTTLLTSLGEAIAADGPSVQYEGV